jgi:hypothetical protein
MTKFEKQNATDGERLVGEPAKIFLTKEEAL